MACLGPEDQDACPPVSLGACRQPEAEQEAAEMMKVQLHHHHPRPHQNHPGSASSSDSLLGKQNKFIFVTNHSIDILNTN